MIASIALSRDREIVTGDGHLSEVPEPVVVGWQNGWAPSLDRI
ncbi:MAG TPA: hypothetical protein PLZ42_02590 [Methanothrix sp.]|nr:hypothetical protein [Methanothrix sp.]